MTELEVANTHLYPGARGRVLAALRNGPAVVRFSDGCSTSGTLADDLLSLDGWTTAAGTEVPPKAWRIAVDGDAFRVTARG